MTTEKKVRQLTPLGEAKWAHIHTPKAAFVDEHGKTQGAPKYQIDILFAKDDKTWSEWAKKVMDKLRDLPEQIDKRTGNLLPKQSPIKRELDEAEQPTGRFYVTFKTSDKFKPGLFDRFGKTIPENILIGNGSLVRVSYIENIYTAFGGGINFYLNAVQVAELVEYKSQTAEAYGFPVDESEQLSDMPNDSEIPF